ncbi:MAG: SNF1-interacting protein [Tremellales sp. Tagirdzhanova-0007]|nr:MAG: SNF1-interacting protein [Tremellales sp. Tagirdzhanova-0007]
MGNASSHPGPPSSPMGTGPASGAPQQLGHPPSAQPNFAASQTAAAAIPTSTGLPTGSMSSAFHSGLTPPHQPPSPPPPPTPPLLPHGGHLSPQNPHALSHPQAHDYSKSVVTRLIVDGKLAPFYRGIEDWEDSYEDEDIAGVLQQVREKDYAEGVGNSVTEAMKLERDGGNGMGSVAKRIGMHRSRLMRMEEEKEERERRERKAYVGAMECPICFLSYPPNINTSRCCQQPLCTECFVQIRRSEATVTHLESEPACCPFCVETDFGVIYERPLPPLTSLSSSALASSPDASASGVSHALSQGSDDAELNVGPGMAPKVQETMRRKSVNAKSKEVVTIADRLHSGADEIRPDWESKLNAVKAAAARKASRRIVMRQVGDRLIPIGYTSSRAPGTANFNFSMLSSGEGEHGGMSRSRRRGSHREEDLEERMIEEAMRLSLVDHVEHQRKIADDNRTASPSSGVTGSSADSSRRPSFGMPSPLAGGSSTPTKSQPQPSSAASKLFSKFGGSGSRSRAGSSASNKQGSGDHRSVTFAPTPTPTTSGNRFNQGSTEVSPSSPISRFPPSGLTSPSAGPVAPVMTFDDSTSISNPPISGGLPRLSMDMSPLAPDFSAKTTSSMAPQSRNPFYRADSAFGEGPTDTGGITSYSQLESDEED